MHPVHSWKCSQMTDGLSPWAAARATFTAAVEDSPTDAAAIRANFMKSRRPNSESSSAPASQGD